MQPVSAGLAAVRGRFAEVVAAWQWEQLGACFFDGVAESCSPASLENDVARLLARVERSTAGRIAAALGDRAGPLVAPSEEAVITAQRQGRETQWAGLAGSIATSLPDAIALYRSIAASFPDLSELAVTLIAHELALADVINAGLSDGSSLSRLLPFVDPPDHARLAQLALAGDPKSKDGQNDQ